MSFDVVIIDKQGHYTTVSAMLLAFRQQQLDGSASPGEIVEAAASIPGDEIRASIVNGHRRL